MSIIGKVFGASPFGPLLEHAKKVYECVKLIKPLMESMINENYQNIRTIQDEISKMEYEADQIKHDIRENLHRRYLMPVSREDIDDYLSKQDKIADAVEDVAVILLIRKTKIHPDLKDEFTAFVEQIVVVADKLLNAAQEMQNLAETSFGGAEAQQVLSLIEGLGAEEWKSDRMQRQLSMHIYEREDKLDPITIFFYDKIIKSLSQIANAAENTGDVLRTMIVKGH